MSMYAGEMSNEIASSALLTKVCEELDFDIAEIWLRDASKHKLVHYHVSDVVDRSVRRQAMKLYEGEAAQKMKHRLSAAMCKLTKETKKVFKLTSESSIGAQALQSGQCSGLSVAMAVPFSHEGINMTILTFCVTRSRMEPQLQGHLNLEEKGEQIEKMAHSMIERSKEARSVDDMLSELLIMYNTIEKN
mmetsp:Transcript_22246/g.31805  ORF Transcript_22246/g.31805 Transcript_22246/m.31805 type:complete len:190 (+) Transcript_22246:1107-1676(+)